MSRLERRPGTTQSIMDAIASYRKSIDDRPSDGIPRLYQKSPRLVPGELSVINTSDANKIAYIPNDIAPGERVTAFNNGNGAVTIQCPAGTKFLDGSVYDKIWESYVAKSYVKISNGVFAKLEWSHKSVTAPPWLSWSSVTQFTISPASNNGTEVRIKLQDGKIRYFTTSLTWDITADLDIGSEANSTWYQLFLIPDSSNDDKLDVVGTTAGVDTGPFGYSNYRYIGSVFNDSSGNLVGIEQYGANFWYFNCNQWPVFYSVQTTPTTGAWGNVDLVTNKYIPPDVVGEFIVAGMIDNDANQSTLIFVTNNGTPSYTPNGFNYPPPFVTVQGDQQMAQTRTFPNLDGKIYHYWENADSVQLRCGIQGWTDKYLMADYVRERTYAS